MDSDLECGICYQTYNAGLRCPRELHCKHSFCESCLLAISRPRGPAEDRLGADIVCPLCRHITSTSGEMKGTGLRVAEELLELLLVSGVLENDEDQLDEEASSAETDAEGRDSSAVSRGGRLRRCWRTVWRAISRMGTLQWNEQECMTKEDMKNLAMMSSYMF
ncbi:uncharacterized protein ACBR49_019416 [Aulostomus maculatus]